MIAFDPVGGVPLGVVERRGQKFFNHVLEYRGPIGHHLVWLGMGAQRAGEEPAGGGNVAPN